MAIKSVFRNAITAAVAIAALSVGALMGTAIAHADVPEEGHVEVITAFDFYTEREIAVVTGADDMSNNGVDFYIIHATSLKDGQEHHIKSFEACKPGDIYYLEDSAVAQPIGSDELAEIVTANAVFAEDDYLQAVVCSESGDFYTTEKTSVINVSGSIEAAVEAARALIELDDSREINAVTEVICFDNGVGFLAVNYNGEYVFAFALYEQAQIELFPVGTLSRFALMNYASAYNS